MKNVLKGMCLLYLILLSVQPAIAQRKKSKQANSSNTQSLLEKTSLSGLKFRSVGPALTSGRISDFAVHPKQPKVYYVATSSGGVWKTNNAGTTYKPIFDKQGSYSIGCVTIDPNYHDVIWVGTGENNNQRSVAYGDGVYKSEDGGASWQHMGLKNSEHIGRILVHPNNSDVIFVAAIGPLWSSGGDRGLYKSIDGGNTWEAILTVDEHTGVNDVIFDATNPNIMYASTYQRRRHVFTYLGGGPGSAIYKSTDGGLTWNKASKGLPGVDIGRIGLSAAPQAGLVYAIVEAAQGKGGFFASTNYGASWSKRSSYSSSGNYYQEIIVDPHNAQRIFSMNTWMQVSKDGGKTWKNVGEDTKHVDNHCLWIDPTDTDHLLAGCDGGIYESWDAAKTWAFKANLPVTQFYKVAVDNDLPFYNIYGGTQDNFSLGGPSRTTTAHGIMNSDWYITHGGDGFESQIDPENPDIVYAQSQYGFLVRYDRKSGEEVGIQPKPRKDEATYRWNWDAPLAVSAHKPSRIYFAANKLFKSDDRGNSWQVISDDLTQQIDRNKLKVMDRIWGVDAVAKNLSTSPYGTIVAFSESPLNESLLYVGTDDGLIQVTENGGQSWRKVSSFPGVPANTYVNAVLASQHDQNVVYACFNHHKYGNFKPYVYKSSDKGQTWQAITGNLPERGSAYTLAEDHQDANLLFVGTEFGVFFSNAGGSNWKQLKAGLPTVAVRDIALQQRENDLVLGTFGRGFYVLDDYSALRNVSEETLQSDAALFAVRDALLYSESTPLGLPGKSFQGDNFYVGDNLGPEAMFTYYLKEGITTKKEDRRKKENEQTDDPFPSYDEYLAEADEAAPFLLFTVSNQQGEVIRKITTKAKAGLQRIHWDLRYASKNPITLRKPAFYNPFAGNDQGTQVLPGQYTVTLYKSVNGEINQMADPVKFNVTPLNNTTLPAANRQALVQFQAEVTDLYRVMQGTNKTVEEITSQVKHIKQATKRIGLDHAALLKDVNAIEQKLKSISRSMAGDEIAARLDIDKPMAPMARVQYILFEMGESTSAPTVTFQESLKIAKTEFKPYYDAVKSLVTNDLKTLQEKLEKAGAPYTPYTIPEWTGN